MKDKKILHRVAFFVFRNENFYTYYKLIGGLANPTIFLLNWENTIYGCHADSFLFLSYNNVMPCLCTLFIAIINKFTHKIQYKTIRINLLWFEVVAAYFTLLIYIYIYIIQFFCVQYNLIYFCPFQFLCPNNIDTTSLKMTLLKNRKWVSSWENYLIINYLLKERIYIDLTYNINIYLTSLYMWRLKFLCGLWPCIKKGKNENI